MTILISLTTFVFGEKIRIERNKQLTINPITTNKNINGTEMSFIQPPTIDDVWRGTASVYPMTEVTLKEKKHCGDTVKLTFKLGKDQTPWRVFEAGDFTKFFIPTIDKKTGKVDPFYSTQPHVQANPHWFARTYSIASTEEQYSKGIIEVLYAIREDGYFNHYVNTAEIGSKAYIRGPGGKLRNSQLPVKDKLYFITTGTGIAPILSKLPQFDYPKSVEIWASFRTAEDIVGEESIREAMKDNPNIKLYITLTRETKEGYLHGRLQNHIDIHNIDKINSLYCLVGGPDFVEDFEKKLTAAGATVATEDYFLSGQKEWSYDIIDNPLTEEPKKSIKDVDY